ncbi:MAG: T9SS type A sorting domain-containing protein [Crocinitomicaceae bacterium]
MKNKYFLVGLLACSFSVNAQNFSDDFESYSVGDFIGASSPVWTTWTGAVGGSLDAAVTNADASNGSHSIYFQSTNPNGGPQDIVLPFGGAHNSGQFSYKSSFFVESGKGAYFNFQGSTIIGDVYTLNCFMVQDGELILDNGDAEFLSTTYPINTWFELEFAINLNTNNWELLIDGVSKGTFQNTENRIASIDIYPVNNSANGNDISGFYVDEVSFNLIPYTLPSKNGAAIAILNTSKLAGQEISPTVTIRNLGVQNITSCDVTLAYNGTSYTESVSGLNLTSYDTYNIEFLQNFMLIAGNNDIVATISNINGTGADDDMADDIKTVTLNPLVPATGKVVVAEEGTGTWCAWCPRGAVAMDNMTEKYGQFFAGIAVHNGGNDPMVVTEYDSGLGITSFPGSVTDRGPVLDPTGIESQFLERIIVPPSAFITNGIYIDNNAQLLHVSVKTDFQTNLSGDYRIACVVVEDSVTGTTSGYNQANAYAGGATIMGGYENLPNPVPASQMVYQHVARSILPSFDGQVNSFPAAVNSGDVHYLPFEFPIDPSWDLDHIHIVSLLIDPSGRIDNAGSATIEEGLDNGYYYLEIQDVEPISKSAIFPNPAAETAFIDVISNSNETVSITVYDLSGKQISLSNYGVPVGTNRIELNVSSFASGVYNVQIKVGQKIENQKLVVR